MEFAASILTAIDVGAKLSKTIHSVIIGLVDAPDNLQNAATAVNGLLPILQQLRNCHALDEPGGEVLMDRLLKCHNDLDAFCEKLEGLSTEDSETRGGRCWKRIKTFYNEKELDKMGDVVVRHTTALNLHLSALQSETVFQIPAKLATIDRRLVSQQTIPGQLDTISQELVQPTASFERDELDLLRDHHPIIDKSFITGTVESMKLILDEVGYAGCCSLVDESLLFLYLGCNYPTLAGIKLLLQHGASIHDRDSNGNTCLHYCLNGHAQYMVGHHIALNPKRPSDARDGIVYLTQQGADVFATNDSGESVSYMATRRLKHETIFTTRFREELWHCALANCGYNLVNFPHTRRPAAYSRPCRHTKEYFEELWVGCEHLRPDYEYENGDNIAYDSDSDEESEDGGKDIETEERDGERDRGTEGQGGGGVTGVILKTGA